MVRIKQIAIVCAAILACLVMCQCKTERTVKNVRQGGWSFDSSMWGGQGGGGDDSGQLRSRFAESGYQIGEDGSIVADNPNLYSDSRNARGVDGSFGKKEARFRKTSAETKDFRMPAYLEMQEFTGVNEARESGAAAREGGSRSREGGRLFAGASQSEASSGSTFATSSARGVSRDFSTSEDREGMDGLRNSARAEGVRQTAGYTSNAGMTMDDVRKLLSPGTYADAR